MFVWPDGAEENSRMEEIQMSENRSQMEACRALAAAAVIALAAVASAAAKADVAIAGRTLYRYTSEPGDYIGNGQSNHYTPGDATISVSGTAQYLTLSVFTATEFWFVNIAAPQGQKLRPGAYYQAERAPFRTGRSPGLDVSGDGRGCNEVWGSFAINQIATDQSGNVTMLDADFTQHCESQSAPKLQGTVLYQARRLSYAFVSDPGDYIGGGVTKDYDNSTSIFTLSGNAAAVQYGVSGERDNWTALIAAPLGQTLQPGSYPVARFADATHAGLDIFGDGRGCNQTTGTLTIDSIGLNGQGGAIRLGATFEQHCEGGAPALHGTIHHRD
jgi:hypothetical protein